MKSLKKLSISIFTIIALSCAAQNPQAHIEQLLSQWHADAAASRMAPYLDLMAEDAVFIGTEAGERWDKKAFAQFARPYFEKGKGWRYQAVSRHISLSPDGQWAWFDEVLDSDLGLCRGSGVLHVQQGQWKMKQYVLSMTIPNDQAGQVRQNKKAWDDQWIKDIPAKP